MKAMTWVAVVILFPVSLAGSASQESPLLVREWALGFHPVSLAVGPNGNLFVCGGDTALEYSPNGELLQTIVPREGVSVHSLRGIAVSPEGDIYLADRTLNKIIRLSSSAELISQWGLTGPGSGELSHPSGVGVHPSGQIFVVDEGSYRVQIFDPDGTFRDQWGASWVDGGHFGAPKDIAFDSEGNVLVADYQRGVLRFTVSGEFLQSYPSSDLPGLCSGSDDVLYLAEQVRDRVRVIDLSGATLVQWGSDQATPEGLAWPLDVALGSGHIYVADSRHNRVAKYLWAPTEVARSSWGLLKDRYSPD